MFNQLLKLGALIATGRFLKPRLKGLLWIGVVWLLLWYAHSEYVQYVELSGDTSFVWKASLIKTLIYALSIAVYVLLVERPLWPRPVKAPPPHRPAAKPARGADVGLGSGTKGPDATPPRSADDDGFDFLRNKARLRSSTDDFPDSNR